MKTYIAGELESAARITAGLSNDNALIAMIEQIAHVCVDRLKQGAKIIFAGNGGSAADAQHLAAELVGRFYFERRGLPAIALNTDTSMITAIGNDYGFEYIFERQLEANGNKGDVFIGMSTSGKSKNILNAIRKSKEMEVVTIGLTGLNGHDMQEACEYCIMIPSDSTPRIQEAHTIVGHAICAAVEQWSFSGQE